jgi:tripartite-type tricarboxylate transporter receptor subunit TctC
MIRYAFAGLLAIAAAGPAWAQPGRSPDGQWPTHPLRLIVPLPAGAAADVVGRLIGQRLTQRLGQPVIVQNRAGASGAIGTEMVAKSAPDGYTLGMATATTHVTAAILNRKLNYDPVEDFAPVSMVGLSPYVLTVHPGVAAKTLAELIAVAKAKPGMLSYSSVGEASLAHLASEQLSRMAGIKLNHIPYKSSTQAVLDLIEGRIDMQFGILTTTHQFIRNGALRALAVTTEQRVEDLPEIPTMSEAGLPGYEASLWFAVMLPAGTPPDLVARLRVGFRQLRTRRRLALWQRGAKAELARIIRVPVHILPSAGVKRLDACQ